MKPTQTDTFIAVILLPDRNFPDRGVLHQIFKAQFADFRIPPETDLSERNAPTLFLEQGMMCTVMNFDAPCPLSKNDDCFQSAWYWPKAWDELKNHASHIVVSVSGGADAKARAILFGSLIAAVLAASPSALGVTCDTSGALVMPGILAGSNEAGSNLMPMPLCVSVRVGRQAGKGFWQKLDRLTAITKGLNAFGLMEIEASDYSGDPRTLYFKILDLAKYLIDAGPVIKDNDTIGLDANSKIVVRHSPSQAIPGTKAYNIKFL